jgi:tetratricopeptide (TPR) repeat protein
MTDWLTASAMLLSGVIVGFMIVYSMKRSGARREDGRRDLEAKRDALVDALRNETNETERARLEIEAANVLRQLDGIPPATGNRQPSTPRPRDPATSQLKGFLWGATSVAAVAGILWFVTQSAKPRDENQPVTGNVAPAAVQQSQQGSDATVRSLEESVRAKPDDLVARDDLAKAYLDRDNLMAVFEQTQFVLQRAPDDPRALTYQGIVRIGMGQVAGAVTMLQRAIKNDPSSVDAYVALAFGQLQLGKEKEAEEAIREAVRRHPEEQARLAQIFDKMRAQRAGAAAPSMPDAPPTPASNGTPVHVTLQLESGAAPAANGVIYVIARAAGQTAGPPAAVKRLALAAFPMTIELSSADSMMGQPLPDKMRIEARIDSDGNAMTRDPADPHAAQDGVTAGAAVTLVLRKQ